MGNSPLKAEPSQQVWEKHQRQRGAEETRAGPCQAAAGRDSQEIKGSVQDTLEQALC